MDWVNGVRLALSLRLVTIGAASKRSLPVKEFNSWVTLTTSNWRLLAFDSFRRDCLEVSERCCIFAFSNRSLETEISGGANSTDKASGYCYKAEQDCRKGCIFVNMIGSWIQGKELHLRFEGTTFRTNFQIIAPKYHIFLFICLSFHKNFLSLQR